MSDSKPVILHAETLDFDEHAGTLKADLPGTSLQENPPLKLDQIIAILRPSPSAQPVYLGLVEHDDSSSAATAEGVEDGDLLLPPPFQLVAIQSPADIPASLSSVPRIAQLPTHLTRSSSRAGGLVVDYLVSTKAGTGRAVQFWDDVLRPLLRFASQSLTQETEPDRVVVTDSDDSVRAYARETHPPTPRTIVLLSGDGGVVDLLNSSTPPAPEEAPLPSIVLIPLGTGNALFNSLHKPLAAGPSELVLALRTLLGGVAAPLPTFKASFPPGSRIVKYTPKDEMGGAETPRDEAAALDLLYRQETDVRELYGSIVASYGFHASIVYESDTPAYRAHGAARFGMVAQQLLKEYHHYAAQIAIRRPGGAGSDALERIPRDEHAYVLAAMVSNLERTFTISPASRPLDGQLRLVHFEPLGPERSMEAMMKAYDGGKHVDVEWEDGKRIYYDDIDEMTIQVDDEEERWRKVCIDGTIVDIPKGGVVHVQREAAGRFNIVVDSHVL